MVETSYRTPQAFGKAVQRLNASLPNSPRKKKAVVVGLASKIGLKLSNKSTSGTLSTTTETDKKVKEFFLREDIVYTMPG